MVFRTIRRRYELVVWYDHQGVFWHTVQTLEVSLFTLYYRSRYFTPDFTGVDIAGWSNRKYQDSTVNSGATWWNLVL